MLHVIAAIELAPGRRDEFLREFHALVPTVSAEDGCLEYGPTVDVTTTLPMQSPPRPNVVTVVEKWRDLPALEAHLAAPHMQTYRERVRPFVVGVTLQILAPV